MAFLFKVENSVAKPNVETLLVSPFQDIWERDKSKDKSRATKEFTFIEFMTSKKKTNPYAGYDEDKRYEKLKELLFPVDWQPDLLIEQAMAKVVEFQQEASQTYQYYISASKAAEKMRTFFNTFDINERNERTGNPVYKPADITRALNDTDKVLQNLNSMKDKVEQELFEMTKSRNNRQINPFEV